MSLVSKTDLAKALDLERFKWGPAAASAIMKLLRIDEINELHDKVSHLNGSEFLTALLKELDVEVVINEQELAHIPETGPVICLANHPFGGLDGIVLMDVLTRRRQDTKVMANFLLEKIEGIRPYVIPVNPFGSEVSDKSSLGGIKGALTSISEGKIIGIFPAGEVSSLQKGKWRIRDKEWNPSIGRIIQKSKATVVPIYFQGHNSTLFNLLGLLNPNARTAKLPAEFLNKAKLKLRIRIGKPQKFTSYESISEPKELMAYFRSMVYALGQGLKNGEAHKTKPFQKIPEQIPGGIPADACQRELDGIKDDCLLFEQQNFSVFVAPFDKIPLMRYEIGRMREMTFRKVGEGTDRSMDLDEFDESYLHLFIWDHVEKTLVGAYRIGQGDKLFAEKGLKGFYVDSLFKIKHDFVPILNQCVELGRSFVNPVYQQKPLSLMLLWKGLLTYLKLNPQYKYLFGPVTLSNQFSEISKELMVSYLQTHHADPELAKWVQPIHPYKTQNEDPELEPLIHKAETSELNIVDNLISQIEMNGAGFPVLFKKYLKQNAKILAFNIDPKFNNAIDGLMLLDMSEVPEDTIKMLEKN